MAALKTVFVKLFEPFLAAFIASLHAASSGKIGSAGGATPLTWDFAKAFEGWDLAFDKLLRGFEEKASKVRFLFHAMFRRLNSHTRNGVPVFVRPRDLLSNQVRPLTIPAPVSPPY
jgi:hypothetical protein